MNITLQLSDTAYQRLVSTLRIGLDEVDVIPSQVIEDESKEASAFIEGMYDNVFGY